MDASTQHLIDGLIALAMGIMNFALLHRKAGNLQAQVDALANALADCLANSKDVNGGEKQV